MCDLYYPPDTYVHNVLNGFAVVWSLVCDAWFRPGRPLSVVTWVYQQILFPYYSWGWATDSDYYFTVDQGIGKRINDTYVPVDSALIRACAFTNIDSVWFTLPYVIGFVLWIARSNWQENVLNMSFVFSVPFLRLFLATSAGSIMVDKINFVLEVVYASVFLSATFIWSFLCTAIGLSTTVCEPEFTNVNATRDAGFTAGYAPGRL